MNRLKTSRSITSSGLIAGISGAWPPGTAASLAVLGTRRGAEGRGFDVSRCMDRLAGAIPRWGFAAGPITVAIHSWVKPVSAPSNKPVPVRMASLTNPPSSPASNSTPSPGTAEASPTVPAEFPVGPMMLLNNRPARPAFRTSASSVLWAARIFCAAWVMCSRRPGLMSPSAFRFVIRLFFRGIASGPGSIDSHPNGTIGVVSPVPIIRVAETTWLCPGRPAGGNREEWSGRPDSNWRPPAPKAGALPGCATPRH